MSFHVFRLIYIYYGINDIVKLIYSEKATKFCEIFPLLLTVCTLVKSKGKISQNFVAFSEYMNFTVAMQIISGTNCFFKLRNVSMYVFDS